MDRTWEAAARHENEASLELVRTWKRIEKRMALDAERSGRDMNALGDCWRREFDQWESNQDTYRRGIERTLRGKPERIERNAIKMLY